MNNIDGGCAFPQVKTTKEFVTDPNVHSVGGMSLRDYFAARAMQGFLSGPMNRVEFEGDGDVAALSYIMADAMLAERTK